MYKFKSQATGDVIMLAPQGDRLLGLIGKPPSRQGILEVADMPAALSALAAAIEADEAASAGRPAQDAPDAAASASGETPGPRVSLRQRAFPLQTMIQRSLAAECVIVWGV
jgi:hypothetical protein